MRNYRKRWRPALPSAHGRSSDGVGMLDNSSALLDPRRRTLLGSDARLPDYFGPFRNFAADERSEFLGRTGTQLAAFGEQHFLDVWHCEYGHDLAVQARDDFARRLRRREHTVPDDSLESRKSGFGDRRHIRHQAGAGGAARGDRPDLAFPDELR